MTSRNESLFFYRMRWSLVFYKKKLGGHYCRSTASVFLSFNCRNGFLWIECCPASFIQCIPQILIALKKFSVQFLNIDGCIVFYELKLIFFRLSRHLPSDAISGISLLTIIAVSALVTISLPATVLLPIGWIDVLSVASCCSSSLRLNWLAAGCGLDNRRSNRCS